METIVIHKTRSESGGDVLHVLSGKGTVRALRGSAIGKFCGKAKPCVIRSTFAGIDAHLLQLRERGYKVIYAPWAKTGIEKNLSEKEILKAFASLPEETFYEIRPRADVFNLRRLVDERDEILRARMASVQRLESLERRFGPNEVTAELRKWIAEDRAAFEAKATKAVEKAALEMPECRLFAGIAGLQGGMLSAAKVVALSGGPGRFHSVSAWWKFFGMDVRDGKAPRRKKGEHLGYATRNKTAVLQLADSIIKNRDNPWRNVYDEFHAAEMAAHDAKCPACKTKQTHVGMRSRRKMMKAILKKFFLAVGRRNFDAHLFGAGREEPTLGDGHFHHEIHPALAIPKSGSRRGQKPLEAQLNDAPSRPD